MEDKTWVKLYRKSLESDIIKDRNAWHVFTWLLLKVDKITGEKKIARSWASEELNMSPGTLYDALNRIVKKYKMATANPTANYTTIRLLNWAKYQSKKANPTANPTATQQQPNTLQEYRIREINNIYEEIINYWNSLYNSKYKSSSPLKENVAYWLRVYDLDQIKQAIANIANDKFWKDKMTPTILFRQRNPNKERVDYIGDLLNLKTTASPFSEGFTVHKSE